MLCIDSVGRRAGIMCLEVQSTRGGITLLVIGWHPDTRVLFRVAVLLAT